MSSNLFSSKTVWKKRKYSYSRIFNRYKNAQLPKHQIIHLNKYKLNNLRFESSEDETFDNKYSIKELEYPLYFTINQLLNELRMMKRRYFLNYAFKSSLSSKLKFLKDNFGLKSLYRVALILFLISLLSISIWILLSAVILFRGGWSTSKKKDNLVQ